MIEYLACGNIMSDIVEIDGQISQINIGGPALYALAGIRLWTKNCKLVSCVGEDDYTNYGKWMDDNGLSKESMLVEMEHGTYMKLIYNREDGGYNSAFTRSSEYLGYLKTHAYHIDNAASNDVKGIYMANNADKVVWRNLKEVKEKYGFKIMWEVEYANMFEGVKNTDMELTLDKLKDIAQIADMWSINHNEAADLFGIKREDDEAIIRAIRSVSDHMCFYRVGERGSFVITKDEVAFAPSLVAKGKAIDPTGCGNCSTGAAMYAYIATDGDCLKTAIMANISSGFNVMQFGPYPCFTKEDEALALSLLEKYEKELRN